MATKKKINFEKALDELEALVEGMENGDQTLEESLKMFEKGVKLTRECQQAIQQAEQKVDILLNQNTDESPVITPFESHSDQQSVNPSDTQI